MEIFFGGAAALLLLIGAALFVLGKLSARQSQTQFSMDWADLSFVTGAGEAFIGLAGVLIVAAFILSSQ